MFRAEVIGSMLRPSYLKEARAAFQQGRLSAHDFKRVEDRAVDQVIAMQEGTGVEVVTEVLDRVVGGVAVWLGLQGALHVGQVALDRRLGDALVGDPVVGLERRPDVVGRLGARDHHDRRSGAAWEVVGEDLLARDGVGRAEERLLGAEPGRVELEDADARDRQHDHQCYWQERLDESFTNSSSARH